MFRFANPEFLYLLLLVPAFVVVYVYMFARMKKNIKKLGDVELVKRLMPDVSPFRKHLKFVMLMASMVLLVFMLARPQYGIRSEKVERSGIEAIIAVDVSNSMLCQDVSPSRLDKSKMIVTKLIDQLDEDKVGLIAFAGNAVTLLPVTSDYVSAKMFLDQLDPSTVSVQGTCVADAIAKAMAGFTKESKAGKALILITDAEDNEEGALEMAKGAAKSGIRVFVLSVGTVEGGPIPMGSGDYKVDRSGEIVTTRLNEEVGKRIAQAGDGVYIHVDQTEQAQRMLQKEVAKMQKEDFSQSMSSDYDEQFDGVALLLLILLVVEMFVIERTNPMYRNLKLFK